MHKIKKIVDLSWEFTADTPIYPGDPEPSVTVATTLENEGYNLSTLVMGTQTGSHVDAPYHFSNEGATIDQMELDFFLGDAIVVRVTDKKAEEAITMEDIEPYKEQITPGKIVLFNTNWYKKRGTEEFFHHPYVNGEVAHYLVEQGVRFIGIDTINADQTGGTEFPVHDLFSEKRLMIGENWAYFDRIDFENPYIIAIPIYRFLFYKLNDKNIYNEGIVPEFSFNMLPREIKHILTKLSKIEKEELKFKN